MARSCCATPFSTATRSSSISARSRTMPANGRRAEIIRTPATMRPLPQPRRNLILGVVAIWPLPSLAFLLGRGLSRPLTAITAVMNRLSSGDTNVTIPGSERHDELGTMAKAVDVFRRNMIETSSLRGRRRPTRRRRRPTSRCYGDGRPLQSRRRAWSPPSRIVERHAARCQRDPSSVNDASNGPRLQPPRQRRRRPASMQLQRQRRARFFDHRDRPPGPPFQPGVTMPWRRLRRPPRW